MIKVHNLSKKYGNHYAVKNLSFEIEKGNVYGFLGPNGAGKSTTMNIMTGYIAATEGNVEIDGYDIVREPEKAKQCIGYLPEIPPLYQDMTVREYLSFVAELKKVAKKSRKEQIESVMEKTFINDMSERLIKNLSKGYKQRVGLAQAMLGNPEIIILDEPTVGLDPKQIIEIRELIRELKEEHTVILSSHILSEVAEVCDKIMIIAKGRLVASGTSEELLREMGGNRSLELRIKGTEKEVCGILDTIEGISVRNVSSIMDNCVDCIVVINDEREIRDELFEKLCGAKLPVYKMVPNHKSLEDIFLEVTDDKYIQKLEEQEKLVEEASSEDMDISDTALDDKNDSIENNLESSLDNSDNEIVFDAASDEKENA